MDRFASVAAFVQVIESGGFSAAGRHLNLSNARVGHQIQALENALGVRLLNRSTRRISLTEAGRGYYERCVQLLQDLGRLTKPLAPNRQPRAASFASIASRASCSSSRRSSSIF
jgi:DNA-binding transcriptional LysR family regulator